MTSHINLNQLRSFYYAALYTSMHGAAERLHVSVPAVSMQIGKLEEWLGYHVFTRARNKLTLTEQGKELFGHAQRIFKHVEKLEQTLYWERKPVETKILLGAHHIPAKYYMADLLHFIQNKCDALNITMVIGTQQEFICRLLDESIDIAVVVGDVEEKEIVTVPLFEEQFALVTDSGGPYGTLKSVTIEDLANLPLILQEKSTGVHVTVKNFFKEHGVTPTVIMDGMNSDIVKSFLHKHVCASLIVRLATKKELHDKIFHEIQIEGGGPVARFQLAVLRRNQYKPQLQCFLQNATAFPFKELLG